MIEIGTKIVSLDPGSTIIVGLPGSGKTTLVKNIINQYKLEDSKCTINIFTLNDDYLDTKIGARTLSDIEHELKHLILPEIMFRYDLIKSGNNLDNHSRIVVVIDPFDGYILNEDNEEISRSVIQMLETIIKIGSNVKVDCILVAQSDKAFSYDMIRYIQNKILLGKNINEAFEQLFENLDFNGKLGEGFIENTDSTNFNFFKNGN